MLGRRLGLQVSPDRVRVWLEGTGLVLDQPGVALLERRTGALLGLGEEPAQGSVEAQVLGGGWTQPELSTLSLVVEHVLGRFVGLRWPFRPALGICLQGQLPAAAAVRISGAAVAAGAGQCWLVDGPLAAAIGVGLQLGRGDLETVIHVHGRGAEVAVLDGAAQLGAAVWRAGKQVGKSPTRQLATMLQEVHCDLTDRQTAQARERGFHLAGDLWRWPHLAAELSGWTALPVRVPPEPLTCAVRGAAGLPDALPPLMRSRSFI
ncbi:MAG: rod shape-determining protein [Candidatus Dormibacteraeota bacterium]|nr:rod shape-determining protein [Candidatus Dormibacteraeota bacterium]